MTIARYVLMVAGLTASLVKSREKTLMALKKAWKSFENILPQFLTIILVIGMMLAILTPEQISSLLGKESGFTGVLIASLKGNARTGICQANLKIASAILSRISK